MDRHRGPVDLADAPDHERWPVGWVAQRLYVHDRRQVIGQRVGERQIGRLDGQGDKTHRVGGHTRQLHRLDRHLPPGKEDRLGEADRRRHRLGVQELVLEVADRDAHRVRHSRPQGLGHVQVALAKVILIHDRGTDGNDVYPCLDAEMPAKGRDPRDAHHGLVERWDVCHDRPVDRLEGQADPKVRPAKLHGHGARDGTQVAELDADLGRLARARRVGLDADLGLGKEGVLGPVQGHWRRVDLAEPADGLSTDETLHVDHRFPTAQGLVAWGCGQQGHHGRLSRLQEGDYRWVQLDIPPRQETLDRKGDRSFPVQGIPDGEHHLVRLAWDQVLPDIDVALAHLFRPRRPGHVHPSQLHLYAPMAGRRRNPHHASLCRATGRHHYAVRAHWRERQADPKVGDAEFEGR